MTDEELQELLESISGLSTPDVMGTMMDQNIMGTGQQQPFNPPVGISGFDPGFFNNAYAPAVSPDIEQPTETTRFINDPRFPGEQKIVPEINLPVAESMNQSSGQTTQDGSNPFLPVGPKSYSTITGLSPKEETNAFLRGVGKGLQDLFTNPIDSISQGVKTFTDAAANYGVNAPEGSIPKIITDSIYDATKNVDTNRLLATDAKVEKGALDALRFLTGIEVDPSRDQGPLISETTSVQGPQIQSAEPGFPQANFAALRSQRKLTPEEILQARRFADSIGVTFNENTGYGRPGSATAAGATSAGATMQPPTPAGINPFPDDPGVQRTRDELMRRFGAPTINQIQAQDAQRAGRMTQQQTDQAFVDASEQRDARLKERDLRPGETRTQRDTRLARARTQGSDDVSQLSQAEARDLAEGLGKGASQSQKARALQIQQKYKLGQFRTTSFGSSRQTPQQKVSAVVQEVALLQQLGIIKPEDVKAEIRERLKVTTGVDAVAGAGIDSPEFARVSALIEPGGELYNQGIRVDLKTGEVYREKPGIIEGLKPGPRERLPVSAELEAFLRPYAKLLQERESRSIGELSNLGLTMNQFAGTTAQ
tara:strand:+ start:2352 stop:4139 length:1788 start_codon:yes stop_codon:yes gene_type:complete